MNIQGVKVWQVTVESESHEKACILVGQLIVLGSVVDDPSRLHLHEVSNKTDTLINPPLYLSSLIQDVQ